jgi:hypothetical protein
MELHDLNPEYMTHKNKNLDDSQDLLAESTTNLSFINSRGEGAEMPRIFSHKKRKKANENFIQNYFNLLVDKFNSSPINNKILIAIGLIIIIITFFIKIILYFIMLSSLIKRIKKFHLFIFERILDDVSSSYFFYFINYFFLVIGFVIFFVEILSQFIIRYKTLLTINECSLKPLILSKCLFFISLGLVPEVIFANIPFKSKQNIFLSFFKMKFLIQPDIIIILIIYSLFTICTRRENTKQERILQEVKLIKKIVNDFVDKYIFVWNNFNEKNITEIKEKEDKKEEDNNNITNENEENKKEKDNSLNLKKRKTMINLNRKDGFGTVIRRKRKGSKDENEDKSKLKQKFLENIEEDKDDEEDENKKKNSFFKKLWGYTNNTIIKVKLFWKDTLTIIKKYIILGIIAFIIISPVINGIFGYGYYVFYESKVTVYFQIELVLCFIFGHTLILLTNERN